MKAKCNIPDCPYVCRSDKLIDVEENSLHEDEDGNMFYTGVCYQCKPAETTDIPYENVINKTSQPIHPKRKKTMSKSKDWNQTLAAKLLGISTRQLRNYAMNPPDDQWPGWEDAILLKQWKNARDDRDKLNRALAKSLGYKEGFSEAFKRK